MKTAVSARMAQRRLKLRQKARSPRSRPSDHVPGREYADAGRRSAAPDESGTAPRCGFNRGRGQRQRESPCRTAHNDTAEPVFGPLFFDPRAQPAFVRVLLIFGRDNGYEVAAPCPWPAQRFVRSFQGALLRPASFGNQNSDVSGSPTVIVSFSPRCAGIATFPGTTKCQTT